LHTFLFSVKIRVPKPMDRHEGQQGHPAPPRIARRPAPRHGEAGSMNRRARAFAVAAALTTAASGVYGIVAADGSPGGAVNGVFAGLPISLSILAFEALYIDHPRGAWLRRRPFAVTLLVRFVVWGAAIVASLLAMRLVLPFPGASDPAWLLGDIMFGFALLFVPLVVASIDRLLGPGNLLRLLTGKYHHPREEERIFLFLDMQGSTRAAERIGNVAFLELLAACIATATRPLLAHQGEIYRYLGDEIVACWPIRGPDTADLAFDGAIATLDALDAVAWQLEASHGFAPRFRGGLHVGTVAVGEIGDTRREIAFLGDGINVAKRLEAIARDRNARLVVSGHLVDRLSGDGRRRQALPLGETPIAGKSDPVAIFSVAPRGAGAQALGYAAPLLAARGTAPLA
jgi:adenylate cyclase